MKIIVTIFILLIFQSVFGFTQKQYRMYCQLDRQNLNNDVQEYLRDSYIFIDIYASKTIFGIC